MKSDSMKKNLLTLSIIYVLLVTVLGVISYKFFINNFISLEKRQNQNNLNSFAKILDKTMLNLKNITNDYAKWDDTYEFMGNKNSRYIYNNFRDDANTLEDLGIDAMIFVSSSNKAIFSTFNENSVENIKDTKSFGNMIIQKTKGKEELETILEYDSKVFFTVKMAVHKSDFSGENRGSLIAIKFLHKNDLLSDSKSLFKTVEMSLNKSKTESLKSYLISLENIKKIEVFVNNGEEKTVSFMDFYDIYNNYIMTLKTENDSLIIREGNSTIRVFNFIGAIIILLIFIVIYQNQRLIINQNIILNDKVEKRTKQLTKAFRTLKDKNRELYKLANTDSLTNIRNRANFFVQSIKFLKMSNRENLSFSVLMIDIDYFKKINDQYGHGVGDKVLISFCEVVSNLIDRDMIFGRLGGEEFAISIYNKDKKDVFAISETIREECAKSKIEIEKHKIGFTISVGVAFKESKYETIDAILHRADELLYKAKKEGRNRVIRAL